MTKDQLDKYLMIAAAVAGVAVVVVLYRSGAKLAQGLNPVNEDNVVNSGLDYLGRSLSGRDTWTFGGQVYDWTHGGALDWSDEVASVQSAVNPASNGNLINRGVEAIGRAATGSKTWTLGGWIYDVTH
jgi:hypothetical protein